MKKRIINIQLLAGGIEIFINVNHKGKKVDRRMKKYTKMTIKRCNLFNKQFS